MSNIDTSITTTPAVTHTVVPYVIGKTIALEGQRLDVVFWKTPKLTPLEIEAGKKAVKRDSVCVSVPPVSTDDVSANLPGLLPYVVELVQKAQHDIIKARVEEGALHVTNDEISVAACIEWMAASTADSDGNSKHLTKESIGTWFDTKLADNLMVALADKLGIGTQPTEEQLGKLDKAVTMYRTEVCKLAGGKTVFAIPLARSIKNTLALVEDMTDPLVIRFGTRLDKMIAAETELFDLL